MAAASGLGTDPPAFGTPGSVAGVVVHHCNVGPLRLSHGRPAAIGPIKDAAAPRVAVNPSGQNGRGDYRIGGVSQFRVEAELDVAVAPCPGDGAGLAGSARPIAGQLVAIAFELQGALEASSVASERHLPRAGGLRAVLHGGR